MKRRDWTLLAIAQADGAPLSPVQLQKTLFLLGENCPKETGRGFYKFRPYNYGPFSPDVYRDAEALAENGLVRIDSVDSAYAEYSATQDGLDAAARLTKRTSQRAAPYLKAVVDWVRQLTFQELVSAIYERYPEQRSNSVFQD